MKYRTTGSQGTFTAVHRTSFVLCAILLAACGSDNSGTSADAQLQPLIAARSLTGDPTTGLTLPAINTPLAQLGKDLFFTKALGADMDVACASCHHPLLGGGDRLSLSIGVNAVDPDILGPGRLHDPAKAVNDASANKGPNVPRNAQTTFNSGLYHNALFHDGRVRFVDPNDHSKGIMTPDSSVAFFFGADPNVDPTDLLAVQARFPVASNPEMRGFDAFAFMTNDSLRDYLAERVGGYGAAAADLSTNNWLPRFQAAFGQPTATADQVVTYDNIAKAIAAYERSQLFIDNPWFRYVKGDTAAISDAAKRGALLFFADAKNGGLACYQCHSGDHFSDEKFHVVAVPQLGRGKTQGANSPDPGFGLFSPGGSTDDYSFRTPSLLNVEVTGPYGHDGAYDTLEQIIRQHADPTGSVYAYDFSFFGLAQFVSLNVAYPNAVANSVLALDQYERQKAAGTTLLVEKSLTDQQVSDIKAFLLALTDPCTKSATCLAPWIPDAGTDPDPDGHRLVAVFSDYPAGIGNHNYALPVTQSPGTDGAVDVVATLTAPTCTGTQLPVSLATQFRDAATDAGLTVNVAYQPDYSQASLDPYLQEYMMQGGVTSTDIDRDCLPDVYVANGSLPGNTLYHNAGNGTFSDVSSGSGVDIYGNYGSSAMADINGDGNVDLIVAGVAGAPTRIFLGNGDMTFTEAPNDGGVITNSGTYSITPFDYDLDGNVDVYFGHWSASGGLSLEADLWRNNGDGTFSNARAQSGLNGQLVTSNTFDGEFFDFNGDNWPDLLSVADFGKMQVFRNIGGTPTKFYNATRESTLTDRNAMGVAVADFNGDGLWDVFVTGIYAQGVPADVGNQLFLGDGHGAFALSPHEDDVRDGDWAWGACAADFNNSGVEDIFMVGGWGNLYPPGTGSAVAGFLGTPPRLFMNDGSGHFTETAAAAGITDVTAGRSVVCLDYDRDGDIDILVGNNGAPPHLYLNNARQVSPSTTHYLEVKLDYLAGNSDAIGAVVKVTAGGHTYMRQIGGQNGFLGHGPLEADFGLGTTTTVDTLEVLWPAQKQGDGKSIRDRSVFTNVAADRYIEIKHP